MYTHSRVRMQGLIRPRLTCMYNLCLPHPVCQETSGTHYTQLATLTVVLCNNYYYYTSKKRTRKKNYKDVLFLYTHKDKWSLEIIKLLVVAIKLL